MIISKHISSVSNIPYSLFYFCNKIKFAVPDIKNLLIVVIVIIVHMAWTYSIQAPDYREKERRSFSFCLLKYIGPKGD